MLKVKATDKLAVRVDYYAPTGTVNNGTANGLNSVLSSLLAIINSATAPAGIKDGYYGPKFTTYFRA